MGFLLRDLHSLSSFKWGVADRFCWLTGRSYSNGSGSGMLTCLPQPKLECEHWENEDHRYTNKSSYMQYFSNEHWHFFMTSDGMWYRFSRTTTTIGALRIYGFTFVLVFAAIRWSRLSPRFFHWRKHWSELQNFKNIKANHLVSAYICIILYSYILFPTFKDLFDMNDHGFLIVSPKVRHAPHRMAMGKWI